MSKIKLICADVDGTLLNSKLEVPKRNIDAIKKALDQGIDFVIASGRPFDSIAVLYKKMGLKHEGFSSTLGGSLTFFKDKIIDEHSISGELSLVIVQLARSWNICVHAFYQKDFLAPIGDEWIDSERNLSATEGSIYDPEEFFVNHCSHKLLCLDHDTDKIGRFFKELETRYKGLIEISLSNPKYLEINPYGVSKATSIHALCKYLGITVDQVMCIGDFYNDVQMFKTGCYAVAMGNAPDDVKQYANKIVGTNDECGVAEAIEQIL